MQSSARWPVGGATFAAIFCLLVAESAFGAEKNLMVATDGAAPAIRYARLDRSECEAELQRRFIPWTPAGDLTGVGAPVRLTGPLHGVTFHSMLPARQRASSVYEVYDCRLLLALDDFSVILAQANVVEVVHYSVYRPPGKRWPTDKPGRRHSGGLAIDVGKLIRRDGSTLSVEKDFHGHIGRKTCPIGEHAGPSPETEDAFLLWRIVCTASEAQLFNVALTPNYNYPHRNHFHLEVTPDVKWFIVH